MIFFYVFVLALPILTRASSGLDNITKKPPLKTLDCKNIKCPAVENPICVKMKHKNKAVTNKTTYIVMINKCEMNYMKCHQNVDASIVQMKYCDHGHNTKIDKSKQPGNKRAKRSAVHHGAGIHFNITKLRPKPKITQISRDLAHSNLRHGKAAKSNLRNSLRINANPTFRNKIYRRQRNESAALLQNRDKTKSNFKRNMFDKNIFGGMTLAKKNDGSSSGLGSSEVNQAPEEGGASDDGGYREKLSHQEATTSMFKENMFDKNIFGGMTLAGKKDGSASQLGSSEDNQAHAEGRAPDDGGYKGKLSHKDVSNPSMFKENMFDKNIFGGMTLKGKKDGSASREANQAPAEGGAPDDGGYRAKLLHQDKTNPSMFKENMFNKNIFGGMTLTGKKDSSASPEVNQAPAEGGAPGDGGYKDKLSHQGTVNNEAPIEIENMFDGNMFDKNMFAVAASTYGSGSDNENSEEDDLPHEKLSNGNTQEEVTTTDEDEDGDDDGHVMLSQKDDKLALPLVKGNMYDNQMFDDVVATKDHSAPQFASPEINGTSEEGGDKNPEKLAMANNNDSDSDNSEGIILEGTPPPQVHYPGSDEDTSPENNNENNDNNNSNNNNSNDNNNNNNNSNDNDNPDYDNVDPDVDIVDSTPNPPQFSDPPIPDSDDGACPTECAARNVMVCGRCQHGVFRTFLSVCHMKMFQCHHSFEQMQLISHYPCVASAPFLSSSKGMNMDPKGTLMDPGDRDEVLRFIYCRSKGPVDQSGKTGTEIKNRCNFSSKMKLKSDYSSYGYF